MKTERLSPWNGPARTAFLSVSFFFFTAACSMASAQTADVCEPAPAVKAALDQLPTYPSPSQTNWQYREARLAAIRALQKLYPDDLFVQRAYINFMAAAGQNEINTTIDEFKARHERQPDDPRLAYLYGMTLVGRQTPEAIKLFNGALESTSQFPWPHLALVRIYSAPAFLDREKAAAQVKAFLEACPSSFTGFEQLVGLDDRGLAREGAERLRPLLQSRSDPDALNAYTTLWSLEFKARPPSEYDPVRKRVAEDLKRIRQLNLEGKQEWYQALEQGYKLAGSQAESDWAKDERMRLFPRPWELPSMSKWQKDHKYPAAEDPPEKKRAYYTEYLKQSEGWLKERPRNANIWWSRMDAMDHLDNVTDFELEAAVDKALKAAQDDAGQRGLYSYQYLDAAEALSRRRLEPGRVVELSQKALARLEVEAKEPPYDLYASKDSVEDDKFWQASQRTRAIGFEAAGYVGLKQTDKAQAVILQLHERLRELSSLASDKASRKKECSHCESDYWTLNARVAELQSRKLDAMGYYESALLARLQAEEKPETGRKDRLAEDAHKLWASLGGTEEAWKNWYGTRADALANAPTLTWEDANQPLPAFELVDLHGKTWTSAGLKGKVTFLNFWASW